MSKRIPRISKEDIRTVKASSKEVEKTSKVSKTEATRIQESITLLNSMQFMTTDDSRRVYLPPFFVRYLIHVSDPDLVTLISENFRSSFISRTWDEFTDKTPPRFLIANSSVKLSVFRDYLDELRSSLGKFDGDLFEETWASKHLENMTQEFIVELEKAEKERETLRNLTEDSLVSFEEVQLLTSLPNLLLVFSSNDNGPDVAAMTFKNELIQGITGVKLSIKGITFNPQFENFHDFYYSLPWFSGKRTLAQLGIIPLKKGSDRYKELAERGIKVREVSKDPSYVHYSGNLSRRNWFGVERHRAFGRIMIDRVSMSKMDPSYCNYFDDDATSPPESFINTEEIRNIITSPFLYGYSFTCKRWGEFTVEDVQPIVFREDALDHLVMDKSRKDLIHALVEQGTTSGKDFISGKSGGLIFLLEGSPGTGKTLTAEAVSECLRRPLFPVSVGQLGTTAKSLEESLSTILAVAERWQAVLLLDEADIFLKTRTASDVERNALVSVFLRLLEYYSGVLFLTTNRADNLDPAFFSRVSLALHYAPLDKLDRYTIWENILDLYGTELDEYSLDELSEYELNGREIKNIVRLANALAARAERELSLGDIRQIINVNQSFRIGKSQSEPNLLQRIKTSVEEMVS